MLKQALANEAFIKEFVKLATEMNPTEGSYRGLDAEWNMPKRVIQPPAPSSRDVFSDRKDPFGPSIDTRMPSFGAGDNRYDMLLNQSRGSDKRAGTGRESIVDHAHDLATSMYNMDDEAKTRLRSKLNAAYDNQRAANKKILADAERTGGIRAERDADIYGKHNGYSNMLSVKPASRLPEIGPMMGSAPPPAPADPAQSDTKPKPKPALAAAPPPAESAPPAPAASTPEASTPATPASPGSNFAQRVVRGISGGAKAAGGRAVNLMGRLRNKLTGNGNQS